MRITIILFFLSAGFNLSFSQNEKDKLFTDNLMQDSCTFSTTGSNAYFIMQPGYFLDLRGMDGKDSVRLLITVLNETKVVDSVECRIIEERETVNNIPVEISRNYYAFCKQTASIFYFGEDVDIYKNGFVVNHESAWLAGGNNKAGIQMPGSFFLGARYYQEIAPNVAMDRAEIISISETMEVPAGKFSNVLKTEEGTALSPKEKEYKFYAPGIGLLKDEELVLMKYGYQKF